MVRPVEPAAIRAGAIDLALRRGDRPRLVVAVATLREALAEHGLTAQS